MFALGIEFLTGNAVMTSVGSRDHAEWPPHPARVFMAMVAALYETQPLTSEEGQALEEWKIERSALEWLEQQEAPSLSFGNASPRSVVKVYVPVNDAVLTGKPQGVKPVDLRQALGIMPTFRSRQERTFPSVHVGLGGLEGHVYLIWKDASPEEAILSALKRLALKMVRIGHSSSLVMCWVGDEAKVPEPVLEPGLADSRRPAKHHLRVAKTGFLGELDQKFNAEEIEAFFRLGDFVATAKGAAKTRAKEEFKKQFGEEWSRTSAPPLRQRPVSGHSVPYITRGGAAAKPIAGSVYDPNILVLEKLEGRALGLESTNLLIEALRGALLKGSEAAPEWFTGHRAPGEPSVIPHLALMPLPFVSNQYADGHLMGMALAFPRTVTFEERASQLKRLLFDDRGMEKDIELTLGGLGVWTLRREGRASPPSALNSQTWTAAASRWASVTPVVLDQHPKSHPVKNREQWNEEVVASLVKSCRRIGLPDPRAIEINKTSWHEGAPRSHPGPGGMPWLPTKASGGQRQQIHVLLQFDQEVEGPVLLGAGRFRGYGLCKPLPSVDR